MHGVKMRQQFETLNCERSNLRTNLMMDCSSAETEQ